MIVLRWGMLLAVALALLAAFGVTAVEWSASAFRVAVAAVVGLLAPLFWPGMAATPVQTAVRVAGWSAAAVGLAALALLLLGRPARSLAQGLGTGVMLLAILLVTHALVAGLEGLLRRGGASSADGRTARAAAGMAAALMLAVLGALPLWLGPLAEVLSARRAGVIDAVVAFSPLTLLAVASGNDLLRNEWFYQHCNLAVLPVSYPGPIEVGGAYAALGLALALIAFARRRPAARIDPTMEQIRS